MNSDQRPRHSMSAAVCVILTLLWLSPAALGGSLTVQVVDCDGDALSGQMVTVAAADTLATPLPAPPGGTLSTDPDGLAVYGGLGGNYNVTVTCGGGTFTKTVYINPLFFHDQTLVLRCCDGAIKELDWWDYAGGDAWEENLIGASVRKTSWKRPYGNLTVKVIDCTGAPLSGKWVFIVRSSTKRNFGRRQTVGGVVRHRMLAADTYQIYVSCPPLLGPVTVTVAPLANATVVIKCLGTSCTGTPGWQETIEEFPDGSRYKTTPEQERTKEVYSGSEAGPLPPASGTRRSIDEQAGLETVTVATSTGEVALNVPTGWRDSSTIWITVASEDKKPAEKSTESAAVPAASIEGVVVDIGGRKVEARKVLTPILLPVSALVAAKVIRIQKGDGILRPVASLPVDDLGKGPAPAQHGTVVQSGQPASVPSQTPIISREYSIGPASSPGAPSGAHPVELVAGTDTRSVVKIPPEVSGPLVLTEAVKGKPVRTQQVHALAVAAKLDRPLKDGVIRNGQTIGATASVEGNRGLEEVLKKKDVLLTFKSSGGVTVKPQECKVSSDKDSYPLKITGLTPGTFRVDVRVVEKPKASKGNK